MILRLGLCLTFHTVPAAPSPNFRMLSKSSVFKSSLSVDWSLVADVDNEREGSNDVLLISVMLLFLPTIRAKSSRQLVAVVDDRLAVPVEEDGLSNPGPEEDGFMFRSSRRPGRFFIRLAMVREGGSIKRKREEKWKKGERGKSYIL